MEYADAHRTGVWPAIRFLQVAIIYLPAPGPNALLEFLEREDVTRVNAMLEQQSAFPQVLATSGTEYGILDVLTATRSGRLAILELQTNKDPVFLLRTPMIGCGSNATRNKVTFCVTVTFPSISPQSAALLIYPVGPALRSHPATATLLLYLHPGVEVIRVGLTESWRNGCGRGTAPLGRF